jgi:hypothetical protein
MKAGINAMDSTLTSVLAALSGSVIGATTPVLSNFVLQRSVTQRELTNREIAQREELYSEFITKGTACYGKALSQSLGNIDELAAIYALETRHRSIKTATRYMESRKLRCSKASMRRCPSFGGTPDTLHCPRCAILTEGILLL